MPKEESVRRQRRTKVGGNDKEERKEGVQGQKASGTPVATANRLRGWRPGTMDGPELWAPRTRIARNHSRDASAFAPSRFTFSTGYFR